MIWRDMAALQPFVFTFNSGLALYRQQELAGHRDIVEHATLNLLSSSSKAGSFICRCAGCRTSSGSPSAGRITYHSCLPCSHRDLAISGAMYGTPAAAHFFLRSSSAALNFSLFTLLHKLHVFVILPHHLLYLI